METKSSKYRLSREILDQIEWLRQVWKADNATDVVRYAISSHYHRIRKDLEKTIKKSEKSA